MMDNIQNDVLILNSESQVDEDGKNYITHNIIVKNGKKKLIECFDDQSHLAKLFKNVMIFCCRQIIFAHQKGYQDLDEHQIDVLARFEKIGVPFKKTKYWKLPSYEKFDKMFRATEDVDFFNDLPMQTSQQIIKEVLRDFKSYKELFILYCKDKSQLTGKPDLPHYVKADRTTYTITNQDAVVYEAYEKDVEDDFNNTLKGLQKKKITVLVDVAKVAKEKAKAIKNNKPLEELDKDLVFKYKYLKLPKTKEIIYLGDLKVIPENIKEVKIKPFYDTYKISIVEEIKLTSFETPNVLDPKRIIGFDLGVDNFVTTSNNCGLTPFIINGKDLKAYNQWYNKTLANLRSQLPIGQYSSDDIQKLNKDRHNKTSNFYNQCSSYLVKYCIDNNVGTIVVGKNPYWKQDINLGKNTNQNFCFIAHATFINKLTDLASKANINVIAIEESCTSKASFLDDDFIPRYKKSCSIQYYFSGKRVHRGLYKSEKGILINADVNGASNIIKKAMPNAFDGIKDLSYLYRTTLKIDLGDCFKVKKKTKKSLKAKEYAQTLLSKI